MINLNTYIIEKFKISKDIKSSYLSENEYYMCIALRKSVWSTDDKYELTFYYPFYIISYAEDYLEYITYKYDKNEDQRSVIFNKDKILYNNVNKKGYHQLILNNSEKVNCLFLNYNDFFKFVKDIFPEFDENKKYVNNPIENKFSDKEFRKDKLKNYFDNIDNIDNIKCNEQYIKILNIYNCIKKLINEKH